MSESCKVFCPTCDEWIDAKDMEFLNIEENFYGQDLVVFICNACNSKHKSLVIG